MGRFATHRKFGRGPPGPYRLVPKFSKRVQPTPGDISTYKKISLAKGTGEMPSDIGSMERDLDRHIGVAYPKVGECLVSGVYSVIEEVDDTSFWSGDGDEKKKLNVMAKFRLQEAIKTYN